MGEADPPAKRSHADSSDTITKPWNKGIKVGDHERSKFRKPTFTNFPDCTYLAGETRYLMQVETKYISECRKERVTTFMCVCVWERERERQTDRQRVYASELKLMVCAGWHTAHSKSGPSFPITWRPWAARTVLMFLTIYEQACMNTVIYPLPALNKHRVTKEVCSCKGASE